MSGAMTVAGNAAAALQPVPLQQLSSTLATTAPALNNVGRSLIHNGLFNIQQRGLAVWNTNGAYTADRWQLTVISGDTASVTVNAMTDADRSAIADEAATSYLQNNFTGSATANSNNGIVQRIESVRRLSGKTVAISFWAKASAGTPRLGVALQQNFGTGGSPSPIVTLGIGATPALTSTWTRYTVTGTFPGAAGKTFGTNAGTDNSALLLMCSDVSNLYSTGIGQQSAVVQFWGVQLEVGSVATPLEKLDPVISLQECQRFYQVGNLLMQGYAVAGVQPLNSIMMPVAMRAAPTITTSGNTINNVTNVATPASASSIWQTGTVNVTGPYTINTNWQASADL